VSEWLIHIDWAEILEASLGTLTMLALSLGFTVLIGLPLGLLLFLTDRHQLHARPGLYRVLSIAVNTLRSLPFIILLIVMVPVTELITGTSLGISGAVPPLVAGTAPFFGRLVGTALREVDRGLIEATLAMGGNTRQVVWHTLLPESRGGLIAAVTVTAVLLVDYTAMAGVVGGGGLGDLAIRFGYQRFQTDVMVVTVFLLILLVQGLQSGGDWVVAHFSRR
jgi:D-methionine transport system permease protein